MTQSEKMELWNLLHNINSLSNLITGYGKNDLKKADIPNISVLIHSDAEKALEIINNQLETI